MTKPMKYRDMKRALLDQNCTSKPGKGDHEKWYCPCGQHIAVVTRPGENSPGVVDDTIKKLKCLPKGWLQ
ncbi:MAG TPA: type II toxin-antitoxin system HicA family toxin [Nocardioides sp.]